MIDVIKPDVLVNRVKRVEWPKIISPTNVLYDKNGALWKGRLANRGKPFSATDLMFMQPDRIFVTPKADGYEAMLAFDFDRVGHLIIRGQDYESRVCFSGPPGLILQLELIGHKPEPEHIVDAVLADVLSGAHRDHGYYGRMEYAKSVIESWDMPIAIPPMLKLGRTLEFPDPVNHCRYPTDGFVLNYDAAPAFVFRDGFGPARYLKHRYTREVYGEDGRVYEADLNGDILHDESGEPRVRPDKLSITPPDVLAELKVAWTINQFIDRLSVMGKAPASLKFKLEQPLPDREWQFTEDELVYLWTPWRDREFEQLVLFKFGEAGVTKIYPSMRRSLHKYASDNNIMPPRVEISKHDAADAAAQLRSVGALIATVFSNASSSLDFPCANLDLDFASDN